MSNKLHELQHSEVAFFKSRNLVLYFHIVWSAYKISIRFKSLKYVLPCKFKPSCPNPERCQSVQNWISKSPTWKPQNNRPLMISDNNVIIHWERAKSHIFSQIYAEKLTKRDVVKFQTLRKGQSLRACSDLILRARFWILDSECRIWIKKKGSLHPILIVIIAFA
jgi:hypothetical protein